MDSILNDTFKLIINGSSSFNPQHGHKSNLAWILFSYESVNKVYTPILFLFGTIGNCLSVTVFCTAPTHRHLSSSYYLSALAISDTGFLINVLAVWLEDRGYHVITTELTCPLVMYLGQVTCFLSVWLTVSFTVERFFAVCYPLTRPTVCTVARAKKVITVLTLVALVAFSYVWLIARVVDFPIRGMIAAEESTENEDFDNRIKEDLLDPEVAVNSSFSTSFFGCSPFRPDWEKSKEFSPFDLIVCNGSETDWKSWNETNFESPNEVETMRVCSIREEHVYFSSIVNQLDSLLTLILPFIIITYLNVRIALCVWKLKDQRQNIMAVAKISHSASTFQHHQTIKNDHPSSGCRPPASRSCHTVNGIAGALPSPSSQPPASLNSCKSYRINLGSSASLNACNSSNASGPGLSRVNRNHSSSTSASETRVTKTLLLVSTVFLVLNLPAHAVRAVAYVQSLWGLAMVEELQAVQQWANILFNTNFGVNFLLYCVSGRKFRKSLWSIIFNINPKRPTKQAKRNVGRAQQSSIHNHIHTTRTAESVQRVNSANSCQIIVQNEEMQIIN